jgi:hypothetical protein
VQQRRSKAARPVLPGQGGCGASGSRRFGQGYGCQGADGSSHQVGNRHAAHPRAPAHRRPCRRGQRPGHRHRQVVPPARCRGRVRRDGSAVRACWCRRGFDRAVDGVVRVVGPHSGASHFCKGAGIRTKVEGDHVYLLNVRLGAAPGEHRQARKYRGSEVPRPFNPATIKRMIEGPMPA